MSDESQFTNSMSSRTLRQEEQELIRFLLSGLSDEATLEHSLLASRVRDMQDGGMGSIRFVQPEQRVLGKTLVEAQYVDADDVPVSITINTDQNGQLFEVDFWKVDFSPLRRYPKPGNLVFKR